MTEAVLTTSSAAHPEESPDGFIDRIPRLGAEEFHRAAQGTTLNLSTSEL